MPPKYRGWGGWCVKVPNKITSYTIQYYLFIFFVGGDGLWPVRIISLILGQTKQIVGAKVEDLLGKPPENLQTELGFSVNRLLTHAATAVRDCSRGQLQASIFVGTDKEGIL